MRSVETGEEIQLSQDGEALYDYATLLPSPREMIRQGTTKPMLPVAATWSPDSKKLLTYRIDQRKAGRFHWIQFAPPGGGRPLLYSCAYPLPGEIDLPKAEPLIFDVEKRKQIQVDSESHPMLYYGSPDRIPPYGLCWGEDSQQIYFQLLERGYNALKLRVTDASKGQTRTIVDERAGHPYMSTVDRILPHQNNRTNIFPILNII